MKNVKYWMEENDTGGVILKSFDDFNMRFDKREYAMMYINAVGGELISGDGSDG
jgi:hypothetical protein